MYRVEAYKGTKEHEVHLQLSEKASHVGGVAAWSYVLRSLLPVKGT